MKKFDGSNRRCQILLLFACSSFEFNCQCKIKFQYEMDFGTQLGDLFIFKICLRRDLISIHPSRKSRDPEAARSYMQECAVRQSNSMKCSP